MASLQERRRKNGRNSYIVQFVFRKQRRSVFLDAKYPKRIASEVSFYVDDLAKSIEFGLPLERRILVWLETLDGDLRSRLQRAGLINSRGKLTISELIEKYFEAESGGFRPATLKTKLAALKRASALLDFSTPADELTPTDVLRFKNALEKRSSSATCAGTLKALARIYSWGKRLELFDKNPFEQIPKGSMSNKSREHFVSLDVYQKVLEHCNNQSERTLLALYRIGGLRRSEAFEARWEDVNWEVGRMTIRSPKTEHTGNGRRVIPLFKLLRAELEKLHRQERQPKTGAIINNIQAASAGFVIKRAVERAGEPVWERLLQNLRSSRANEIYRKSGEVKESLWIGHTTKVACSHYLHLIDSDFDEAAQWEEV